MLAMFAIALAAGSSAAPPSRVLEVTVYGADACPTGSEDETVVCSRQPEADRYRIPKALRDQAADSSPDARAWASRARELDDASAFTRPEGCSPVGSAGLSGCDQMWLQQWWRDRRQIAAGQP